MKTKFGHPFSSCTTCQELLSEKGWSYRKMAEHLHDLHDPMTSCIYCHKKMRKSLLHYGHAISMDGCEGLEERCEGKICSKMNCWKSAAKIFDTRFYCLEHWRRMPYLPMLTFDPEYHKQELERVRKWTLEPDR